MRARLLALSLILAFSANSALPAMADGEPVVTVELSSCDDDYFPLGIYDTVAARIWSMEYGTGYKVRDSETGPWVYDYTEWYYDVYYKIKPSGGAWPHTWTFEGEHNIPPDDNEGVCQKIVVLISELEEGDEVRFWTERNHFEYPRPVFDCRGEDEQMTDALGYDDQYSGDLSGGQYWDAYYYYEAGDE